MLPTAVRIPGWLVPGALRQLTVNNGNPWVLPGEFTVVRTVPETLRPRKMAAIIMTVTALVVGYAQACTGPSSLPHKFALSHPLKAPPQLIFS